MDLFFPALFIGLFAFLAVAVWAGTRYEERQAFYRHELYQQMVQHPGSGAEALRAMLEGEAQRRRVDRMGGIRLGGLITTAVGFGLGVFLFFIERNEPMFLLALIPLLVGLALMFYGFVLAPRALARRDPLDR